MLTKELILCRSRQGRLRPQFLPVEAEPALALAGRLLAAGEGEGGGAGEGVGADARGHRGADGGGGVGVWEPEGGPWAAEGD